MTVLDLHKRQTEAFIGASPSDIVFHRLQKVDDGAGGKRVTAPQDLDPQSVRVVGIRSPITRVTPDGQTVTVSYAVIGLPELDVKLGDTFDYGGQEIEIVNIIRAPAWRVQAEGTLRGQ